MADVALGDVGIHDVLKGRVAPLVDARHLGEAGIEELLAVSNAACNEGNGHMMTLGSLEDAGVDEELVPVSLVREFL